MAKHGQGHDAFDAESGKWNLLAMDEALNALEQIEPRAARIVELRYFAGLSMEHAAALMGSALSTAERDWRFARAWLAERLGAVRE
jgi:DNA-directed RNA polymerase specialized sigma24 family protein